MNKRPFILVMLLAAATTVSAMDVTVDQAVEMALSNNKSLQSSAIDVDMARKPMRSVGMDSFPRCRRRRISPTQTTSRRFIKNCILVLILNPRLRSLSDLR